MCLQSIQKHFLEQTEINFTTNIQFRADEERCRGASGLPLGIDEQIIGFMVTWKAEIDGKCHAERSLWVSEDNFLKTFHFNRCFEGI